ncbi:MAG: glutathione S-transferase [Pseudomonadota bacterium]
MTYDVYIGDRMFSSWSLRGWLMLEKFNLPYRAHLVGLYAGTMAADLAHLAPARTVPAMQTPAGHVLTDSIAMAETLVEAHPNLPLYPQDPAARALARSLVAEMHSGFGALRAECPMQLAACWAGFSPSDAVSADLDRIDLLWGHARQNFGGHGPWFFGDYTLADAFYAPVAMRIIGYGLPVSEISQEYVQAHLNDPAINAWRADALTVDYDPTPYALNLPQTPWPSDTGHR